MSRTTLEIADPILKELKKMQKREGKTLGMLATELLAEALEGRRSTTREPEALVWNSKPMGLRVDLTDKEGLYEALDEEERGESARPKGKRTGRP